MNNPPFLYSTDIGGMTLGDEFEDSRGRRFRLYQVHTALASSTAALNRVFYFHTTGSFVVHDDVSAAFGATGDIIVAGVLTRIPGHGSTSDTLPQSTSSTTYYVCLCVKGRVTCLTDNGDDIAMGDHIIADPSVDGAVDSVAAGGTTTQTERTMRSRFGIAVADDDNSADTVDAYIDCPLKI